MYNNITVFLLKPFVQVNIVQFVCNRDLKLEVGCTMNFKKNQYILKNVLIQIVITIRRNKLQ
jgi:hypothetical protein